MRVDPDSGLLDLAEQRPSPNCDERPQPQSLDLIVVHGISLPPGQFGGPWIDALFSNRLDPQAHPYFRDIYQLKVSAHVLIRRDGSVLQYVPFTKRAWHAGVSAFKGRERCNDFSVGIELEGSDEVPYEAAQYYSLQQVISALRQAYPSLRAGQIAGHSDIAPGRKTDPGPHFDWPHLYALLDDAGSALV